MWIEATDNVAPITVSAWNVMENVFIIEARLGLYKSSLPPNLACTLGIL